MLSRHDTACFDCSNKGYAQPKVKNTRFATGLQQYLSTFAHMINALNMNFATIILSVYVLVLAVMPCPCDRVCAGCGRHVTKAWFTENNPRDNRDVDLCTPFCVAAQCMHPPVAAFSLTVRIAPVETTTTRKVMTGATADIVEALGGDVWHPPIGRV